MVHKTSGQVEIGVPANAVWKVFTEDFQEVFPKMMPNIFSSIEILEGEGGIGTVLLSNYVADFHEGITYQKEKLVEMDEEGHIIALEVVEGGYKQMGFSYYKTRFEMKDKGESSCVIDCSAEYETLTGEPALNIVKIDSTMAIFKAIETHLLSPPV